MSYSKTVIFQKTVMSYISTWRCNQASKKLHNVFFKTSQK